MHHGFIMLRTDIFTVFEFVYYRFGNQIKGTAEGFKRGASNVEGRVDIAGQKERHVAEGSAI